jgi:MFS family permease
MLSPKSIIATSVIAALVALGPLSTDMYLPAFPALMRAFSADIDEVRQTLSIFLMGFALAQLVYGPLSDRFGRKPVLAVGLLIFLSSSIAIAFADAIWTFSGLRLLQAIGGSAGPVLGRAMVCGTSTVPRSPPACSHPHTAELSGAETTPQGVAQISMRPATSSPSGRASTREPDR